jgi:hypothetical protein
MGSIPDTLEECMRRLREAEGDDNFVNPVLAGCKKQWPMDSKGRNRAKLLSLNELHAGRPVESFTRSEVFGSQANEICRKKCLTVPLNRIGMAWSV